MPQQQQQQQRQCCVNSSLYTRIPAETLLFRDTSSTDSSERETSLSGQAVVRRALPPPPPVPSFAFVVHRVQNCHRSSIPILFCRLVLSRVGDGQRSRMTLHMCNQYARTSTSRYWNLTQTARRVSPSLDHRPQSHTTMG